MNPHLLLAHCQLLTYKIIGLAPIRLNQSTSISTSKENTWFIFSLFRAIFRYDFMIIIAIISLNIFRMWSGVGNNLEKSRITMILLGGLEYGFMWTGVIILLTYYTKQKFIKNLVKRFITLKFNSSNPINIYYSNNAKWRSCFFFFNELITSACSSIFDGLLEEKLTINWIGGELCYSIVILFVTQYALILNVIRDRFVAVNEELMTIIVKYENKERTSAILRNQLILCNAKDILLIKLIRNYENLMEICGEISDFFSFPIFLAIAIATYSIIVNTYWSMVTLVLSVWQHNMLYTNIAAISWFVNTFFPVVALTTSVTGINTEIARTVDIVYAFNRSSAVQYSKSEIDRFSRELQDRQINFTAAGIFELDCSLLRSIVSSVISYLIVLIQFRATNQKHSEEDARMDQPIINYTTFNPLNQ